MANKKTKARKIKATDMLLLAVVAYLCQLLAAVIKSLITDTAMIDYVPLGDTVWTIILRVLTSALWGVLAAVLIKSSKSCGFDPLKANWKLTWFEWLLTAIGALIFISVLVTLDGGLRSVLESFKNLGNFIEILTYFIFIAFQVLLIVLTLTFGQKAGDLMLTKGNRYIPYGGIVLGLCMMTANLLTGGFSLDAVMVFGIQLVYGMVFVFAGKNPLIAAPFIYLMFVML